MRTPTPVTARIVSLPVGPGPPQTGQLRRPASGAPGPILPEARIPRCHTLLPWKWPVWGGPGRAPVRTRWPITDEAETLRRLPGLSELFCERSMRNRQMDRMGLDE